MTEATMPGQAGSSSSQTTPLKDEISGDAARLAQTAKDRLDQAADGRKEVVVGAAQSATSALDRAVDALKQDDKAPDWLTKAFETTARQIESLAGSIEGKNLDDIRRNVTRFARENPMAFLAASAAAGFAAARFLRAGSEYKSHAPESGQQTALAAQNTASGQSDPSSFASADTPIYGQAATPEYTS